jgi:group I intron endonuclease
MAISGIYSITNTKSGKVYYGSSNDVKGRWKTHGSKLRRGVHPNLHLQSSWNKYGSESFGFKIEEEISPDKLQDAEQCYLDWCKLFSFWSYNIGYDAECATRGMKFGPPSVEHRRKIGLANSGSNSANYGKKLSDETRRRMSEGQRGNPKPPRTAEHKKNHCLAISRGNKHFRWDGNIYNFYHPDHGMEICDRHTIVTKYNLHPRSVGYIIQGIRKSCKGWKIYE